MTAVTNPLQSRIGVNDIELCYFEWNSHLKGRGLTLLFNHATGFHARLWDQIIAHLPDLHMVAIDQRGHGRSDKTSITHWKQFGSDLDEFINRLNLTHILGIGHSMGGHALVEAAGRNSARFHRLLLIDPTIASPEAYRQAGDLNNLFAGQMHPASKRKNQFTSAAEMFERFRERHPYSLFTPEVLRSYCDYGLLPNESGDGMRLACPPTVEASVYMTSRTNQDIYLSVHTQQMPVLIVRAKEPKNAADVMDFANSPTYPGLVKEFPNAEEIHFEDRTHFMPMEIPVEIAGLIKTEIAHCGNVLAGR